MTDDTITIGSYRCTECGTVHDDRPDHCPTCGAVADEFFEAIER